MKFLDLFKRAAPKTETRAAGAGFTAEVMAARESWISGRSGLGDLTAIVQSCISLWEGGLSQADVRGTDLLTPSTLALTARSLALRGEAVFLIGDRLIPATDWEVRTGGGQPRAYRLSMPEAGGGRSETRLAAEILHIRLAADAAAPWAGQAPLRRASLTASLLHSLETALAEIYSDAPMGSQVVPMPETPDIDREQLARDFRGRRGRVLLRESVAVSAAGGPAPAADWRPSQLSPAIKDAMAVESVDAARAQVANAFGVLPAMLSPAATGPVVREGQRHLATWQLAHVAGLIAEEASAKLAAPVSLNVHEPLQAFDAGGRARAFAGVVEAMAVAKAGGLTQAEVEQALKFSGVSDGS